MATAPSEKILTPTSKIEVMIGTFLEAVTKEKEERKQREQNLEEAMQNMLQSMSLFMTHVAEKKESDEVSSSCQITKSENAATKVVPNSPSVAATEQILSSSGCDVVGLQLQFSGDPGESSVASFLEGLEQFIEARNIRPKLNLLPRMPLFLKGQALNWYRAHRDTFSSWEDFTCRFRTAFQPHDNEFLFWQEIRTRTQGVNETIETKDVSSCSPPNYAVFPELKENVESQAEREKVPPSEGNPTAEGDVEPLPPKIANVDLVERLKTNIGELSSNRSATSTTPLITTSSAELHVNSPSAKTSVESRRSSTKYVQNGGEAIETEPLPNWTPNSADLGSNEGEGSVLTPYASPPSVKRTELVTGIKDALRKAADGTEHSLCLKETGTRMCLSDSSEKSVVYEAQLDSAENVSSDRKAVPKESEMASSNRDRDSASAQVLLTLPPGARHVGFGPGGCAAGSAIQAARSQYTPRLSRIKSILQRGAEPNTNTPRPGIARTGSSEEAATQLQLTSPASSKDAVVQVHSALVVSTHSHLQTFANTRCT